MICPTQSFSGTVQIHDYAKYLPQQTPAPSSSNPTHSQASNHSPLPYSPTQSSHSLLISVRWARVRLVQSLEIKLIKQRSNKILQDYSNSIHFLYFQNMEMGIQDNTKSKTIGTKHDIPSSKQKFESDDSEGSDLSYQSSLTDEEDNSVGRVEFFKEEMARFFINYPELINKNIIEDQPSEAEIDDKAEKQERINRNWEKIANQILNEAKESSTSLESLAKRISLYRYKIDQSDIIDLLLQEKNIILKEIDAEIQQKNSEANLLGRNEKHDKVIEEKHKEDNGYYSWVNQKIFKSKYVDKQDPKRMPETSSPNKRNGSVQTADKTKSVQRFAKSLHKANEVKTSDKKPSSRPTTAKRYQPPSDNGQSKRNEGFQNYQDSIRPKNEALDQSQITQNRLSRDNSNWRHLINFQPKTEIGRQLSQQIKKNSYSDELGIKRTIINFLSSYKQMVNNQIINKVTLSQKIQKLYSDDAKELLMFYPSKIGNYDNPVNTSNSFKENSQEDKFVKLLKEINEGPLMKYWRQLQENKL